MPRVIIGAAMAVSRYNRCTDGRWCCTDRTRSRLKGTGSWVRDGADVRLGHAIDFSDLFWSAYKLET